MPSHHPGLGPADAALKPDPNNYPDALTPEQAESRRSRHVPVFGQDVPRGRYRSSTVSKGGCTADVYLTPRQACRVRLRPDSDRAKPVSVLGQVATRSALAGHIPPVPAASRFAFQLQRPGVR